jgi:hypothetical protein
MDDPSVRYPRPGELWTTLRAGFKWGGSTPVELGTPFLILEVDEGFDMHPEEPTLTRFLRMIIEGREVIAYVNVLNIEPIRDPCNGDGGMV